MTSTFRAVAVVFVLLEDDDVKSYTVAAALFLPLVEVIDSVIIVMIQLKRSMYDVKEESM